MMKQNRMLQEAGALLNWMRDIRRDLHRHPERGTLEVRGLDVRTGIGGHGVVATLPGKEAGKCVALRADMDALPVEEKNDVPYASATPGVAHCCGHDGHTAILLGAASLLCKFSDQLKGSVKFIFQPSTLVSTGAACTIRPPAAPYP